MNSQTTSCNKYHTQRQALVSEMQAKEALLIQLYEQHVEEMLSTADITCKVLDSTGIETTRTRQYGSVFEGEDMEQKLNLEFAIGGQTFYFKLFNGNTGCDGDCDSKFHCHTWISHRGETLGFEHGFNGSDRGNYSFDRYERELDNLKAHIREMFPDYAPSIVKCMDLIIDNLSDLCF